MDVLLLGADDVAALLEPAALVDAVADAFASGAVAAPPRGELPLPGGHGLLVMPGHRPGGPAVVKHVGLFEDNVARGLPHHPATACAFDAETGALLAVLDATELTAARTAAAAALSVRLAARPDARVAAVVGAGPVARAHVAHLPAVRDFAEIRLARRGEVEAAVRGADVVCLCTSAGEPVLEPDWLAPGAHVTSVGFAPPGGELSPELARRGRLLVETRDAFRPPPAGCAELAGIDPADAAELGEVLRGERPARTAAGELTVYKSMGSVIEDVAAVDLVLRRAQERGAGRRVVL